MILVIALVVIFVITQMQKNAPKYLPAILHTWKFLPLSMRSLRPYDDWIVKYLLCCKFCHKIVVENKESTKEQEATLRENNVMVYNNHAFVEECVF